MTKKLSIYIAILISFIPSIYCLLLFPELDDYIVTITEITLIFTLASLILSIILFYLLKVSKKTFNFIYIYILSGSLLSLTFLAWANLNDSKTTTAYKSWRTGSETDYEFNSKDYYFGTNTLKEEIIVKVKHDMGDSMIIHFDRKGNVIKKENFKISR